MNNKLKFIPTADGTQIRLFPWNYSVLRHEPGRSPHWLINIDPGCPTLLATDIFKEYHTNHNLRWGEDRNETVRILNRLLDPPEEDKPAPGMWHLFESPNMKNEKEKRYYIWVSYDVPFRAVYQITKTREPPTGGGYYDLTELKKRKDLL